MILLLVLSACGRDASTTTTATATMQPTEVPTATVVNTLTPNTVRVRQITRPTAEPGVLATRATPVDPAVDLPLLAAHLERVRMALQQPLPILPLEEGLDSAQQMAQTLALQDERFVADSYDPQSGAPLRSEVFGIYPVRPGEITAETTACLTAQCYRIELYNYALNLSTVAVVNLDSATVLAVNRMTDAQPDIPPHLTAIAQEIAVNAPEVITALGAQPAMMDATMANIKTALSASRCERSRHLCMAPTFMAGDRALWAIVDLTEGTLVGVRWTDLGAVGGQVTRVTEKLLQDEVVTREFCEKSNTISRDGWEFDYILTSSDGLRISNVTFGEESVLANAKLVDWHVSYSNTDGFGYSDAVGCPIFSQAAVVAFNGPAVEEITIDGNVTGFALTQDYKSELWPAPCNYYYSQRYEFYTDGRFRIAFANHGRGCGNNGTYRPVARIVPAGSKTVSAWDGMAWQSWAEEQWSAPSELTTPEGYQFRLLDSMGNGYYVEPGRGQFGDGGRGDNPYVYVTRHHSGSEAPDEGESDLITIGPCCNTDYQQGPEKFIDTPPESIIDTPLVFWYVAQLKNDDTPGQEYCWADVALQDGIYVPVDFPCFAGPMFVPMTTN